MSPKTLTGLELDLDDAPAREAELFLVDGNNLAYRAFFALPEELATSEGFPTGALLGFTNMLFKLLSDYKPKGVAVAWDTRPVHRAAAAEAAEVVYKEGRKPMADLLREQFPYFRPIVEAFGYRNLEFEGWEADDVIATLATQADAAGIRTCVVSTDRDAFQLVSDERLPDDDAARRQRRPGLHAGPRRGALRDPAGPDPGLHRAEGRHLGQHSGDPRHRRQDRRAADRAVRLARVGARARGGAVACAAEEPDGVRRPGARLEGARDDAARPRARLRSDAAGAGAAGPLGAPRDVPPLRVPRAALAHRRSRRGGSCSGAAGRCRNRRRVARGVGGAGVRRRGRRRRRRRAGRHRDGRRGRHRAAAAGAPRRADRARRQGDRRRRRRRHDAARVSDRAGEERVPARRPRRRVRGRGEARARGGGGD